MMYLEFSGSSGAQCYSEGSDGESFIATLWKALHPAGLSLAWSLGALAVLCGACSKHDSKSSVPHKHEHIAPHHGTPVVLGNEEYHVEFVLDAPTGKIQAYILDGELENFIRIQQPSFEVSTKLPNGEQILSFKAVANTATGETVGDTSLFDCQADWLKSVTNFDATLKQLQVRGKNYESIVFNFPKGNDQDEK